MKKISTFVFIMFLLLGFSKAEASANSGALSMYDAIYNAVTSSLEKKGITNHNLTKDALKTHLTDREQTEDVITLLNDNIDPSLYVNEYLIAAIPSLANISVGVNNMYRINSNDINEVKKAVANYGSVIISYAYNENTANDKLYISNKGQADINRQAVIIGWEDNYKDNIGAWLIKDAVFKEQTAYIAYDDESIGNTALAIDCYIPEYDKVYQFDGGYTYDKDVYFGHTAYMANLFVSDRDEYLDSASFFVNSNENVAYEVYVYRDPLNPKDPTSGYSATVKNGEALEKLVVRGTTTSAGYYTVKFKDPIILNPKDEFAIVVRLKSNENVYIPIDTDGSIMAADGTELISCKSNSKPMQSYISMDGVSWEEISLVGNLNVRIKAFTRQIHTPNGNGKLITAIIITAILFGGYFIYYYKKKKA